MTSLYSNNNIVKGEHVNLNFAEKWRNLEQEQRLEVCELLEKQQAENSFSPLMPQKWNNRQVNDSTIRYQGYVAEDEYSFADIPQWYKLNETQQEAVAKKLAQQNNYVMYNGRKISVRDIQAWYFLSEKDKKAVQKKFKGTDLFKQNSKTQKTKPLLSGLCCELNLYLAEKTPENLERVSARIASFVHSGKNLVSGLLKRANLRAKIFSGEIKINGDGANSLNLDSIKLSSIYSTKINDLNNPEKYCDSLNNFKIGRNYEDTIRHEEARVGRISHNSGKNTVNRKKTPIKGRLSRSSGR